MPFDYSRFLHALEARARQLRGLSIASSVMASVSLAALAGMLALRLLRVPFSHWSLTAFVLPPLVAAVIGYAVGRSTQPRIPHLLLRIDDALGLNARLSSLYELRQRGGSSIFRQRIEAEVRDAIAAWQTALPLGRRTVLRGSASACCIALAVGLAFVPLPSVSKSPLDLLDGMSTVSPDLRPNEAGTHATATKPATAPLTLKTDGETGQEPGIPTLEAPDRDQTLEDVMRDLYGLSPDEAVLVPMSLDDIEELARLQGEAMRAITQLLERIRDRLENAPPAEPPELTQEELEALQRELDRGGLPPEAQEGLSELMNRPQPRTAEEIVEQLIDQFGDEEGGERDSSRDGESRPQSTAVAPNQQDIEDLLDELGQASSDENQGSETGVPVGPGESGNPSQDPDPDSDPSSSGDRMTIIGEDGIEELTQVGGSDGPGGASDEGDGREPGFIREEERARIGSAGDFVSEFVTEGVPIELAPGSDGTEPSFRVSYEQIVSILRERGLPEGAIEIVRDYFNAITEGGP